MSSSIIPALIPRAAEGAPEHAPHVAVPAPPLPDVRTNAPASLRWEYAISRVDSSGRVADQSIVRTLAWSSAERVTVTARNMQAVVLRRDADGAHQLTRRRLIQIPAALRARCAIAAGDRVLLAAHPPSSTLIIYSMTSLERLLIAEHEALTCGPRS